MSVFRFPRVASTPGDQPSFEHAALAEADALYRTALRLTRQPAEAEDLVQETYLKAFRNEGRFTRGSNLKAWLFTILMNTWRNRRRDGRHDPMAVAEEVDEVEALPASSVTPEDALLRATLPADLKAALDQMPDGFREAVWLRDVDEFTYAEIAAMLDVPIGTVMSRISRGRRQLFEALTAGGTRLRPAGAAGQG